MKLLVTGAAGFIGSHLCERLLGDGHQVIGLDAFDGYLYDAATKERNAAAVEGRALGIGRPDDYRLVRGDICDTGLVTSLCREAGGVDVVVHLAALAGVRPSIAEPLRYARTNVEGTVSVLEACRAAGVHRLVFASSSSVYGARPGAPAAFREDDPCLEPASPYAATKRAGELICHTYRDLFGIGVSSLRFFTVYGPRQRPEMAIHKFARALAAGRAITLFGDGTSARDYTYVDDIVAGVTAACERVRPGDFSIFNLGGSRTTTLARLVELLATTLGIEPIIDRQPDQPGDVPLTFADVTHAGRALGYAPRVPIEEGIQRFVAWFRAQPRG